MTPDIVAVKILANHSLEAVFATGERRRFDLTPYLTAPAFAALTDPARFAKAYVQHGTIAWDDETDLSPDTLYLLGTPVADAVPEPRKLA